MFELKSDNRSEFRAGFFVPDSAMSKTLKSGLRLKAACKTISVSSMNRLSKEENTYGKKTGPTITTSSHVKSKPKKPIGAVGNTLDIGLSMRFLLYRTRQRTPPETMNFRLGRGM